MEYGIQLFGLMPKIKGNMAGFMDCAAKAGIRYLEPCVQMRSDLPDFLKQVAWTMEDFQVYMPMMQERGLSVLSCHLFAGNPLTTADGIFALRERYGIRQFVFSSGAGETQAQFESYAQVLLALAEKVAPCGAQILVHNGSGECALKFGELSALEWLLRRCGGKVGVQPDYGWMMAGGMDPETFLKANRAYVWATHYKDETRTETGFAEAEVGTGMLDLPACVAFAQAAGLPHFIDQDTWADPVEESVSRVLQRLRACCGEA